MGNNQKGFIVPMLLAIIALLVIGGGGAYIYQSKKAEAPAPVDIETQQSNQIEQQINTQTLPINMQTNDLNWKKYINSQYGFEFKYPTNVTYVEEEINGVSVFSMLIRGTNDVGLTPTMDINATNLKYSTYKDFSTYSKNTENSLTQCVSKKICKLTYFTVGGLPALQIERTIGTQLSKEVTSFNGNFIYSIRGETLRNGFSFQQLLSTFKFTK